MPAARRAGRDVCWLHWAWRWLLVVVTGCGLSGLCGRKVLLRPRWLLLLRLLWSPLLGGKSFIAGSWLLLRRRWLLVRPRGTASVTAWSAHRCAFIGWAACRRLRGRGAAPEDGAAKSILDYFPLRIAEVVIIAGTLRSHRVKTSRKSQWVSGAQLKKITSLRSSNCRAVENNLQTRRCR